MPEQIIIDPNAIIGWSAFIAAIGIAIGWIAKAMKPMLKPFKEMQCEIEEIEQRSKACAKRFTADEERLNTHEEMLKELTADNKMILESIALLMKHAETGNNTGEVSQGRQELEKYLINR